MDKLFSLIRQLGTIDDENMLDLSYEFIEHIRSLDIENSEIYTDEFYTVIVFNNICISIQKTGEFSYTIEVLINKKYLYRECKKYKYYGISNDVDFYNIISFMRDSKNKKFVFIDKAYIDRIDYGSIDWLLDHKLIKSARN